MAWLVSADSFEDEFRDWIGDGISSTILYIGVILLLVFVVMKLTTRSG